MKSQEQQTLSRTSEYYRSTGKKATTTQLTPSEVELAKRLATEKHCSVGEVLRRGLRLMGLVAAV
jgi:hypothetical protein